MENVGNLTLGVKEADLTRDTSFFGMDLYLVIKIRDQEYSTKTVSGKKTRPKWDE